MHPDVSALLAVQEEDVVIHALEDRLAALEPRIAVLQRERDRAEGERAEVQKAVLTEEKRQREVETRVAQHRTLKERNEQALNNVTSPREATAAQAQLDQATRMMVEDEREVGSIQSRLRELRRVADEKQAAVDDVDARQQEARSALDSDRIAIDFEMKEVRARREEKAKGITRTLLQRYDRISSKRRERALFPLRGTSCSRCDTAIPVQRRTAMITGGATDICEGCGVLLYAGE
ncbi:MAG: hypothetical protein JWO05_1975 [Gemmatimonadetes bacterium]|nr:hypothetical protein [Gemmatimonadota bacterium]